MPSNSSTLGHEKKKPCFTGGRTFQVGSVSRDIFLKYFFFLSGGKNDSFISTKISKKCDAFWEKFWKSILSYFQKIFSQIFIDLGQNRLILLDLAN